MILCVCPDAATLGPTRCTVDTQVRSHSCPVLDVRLQRRCTAGDLHFCTCVLTLECTLHHHELRLSLFCTRVHTILRSLFDVAVNRTLKVGISSQC
jgi:hypothetical protein